MTTLHKISLSIMLMVASAFADIKPPGTVLSVYCGRFRLPAKPSDTMICLSKVTGTPGVNILKIENGSKMDYLVLTQMEATKERRPDGSETIVYSAGEVLKKPGSYATYKTRYSLELATRKFVDAGNKVMGTFVVKSNRAGAQDLRIGPVEMQAMYHTQ